MKRVLYFLLLAFFACESEAPLQTPNTSTGFEYSKEYQDILTTKALLNPSAQEFSDHTSTVKKAFPKAYEAYLSELDSLKQLVGGEISYEHEDFITKSLTPASRKLQQKLYAYEANSEARLVAFENAVAAFAKKYPDVSEKEFYQQLKKDYK